MPLTLPELDDRTWKDLVEESLALIPSLAPEWTNFNASDPGITLVELFAYLTETLLYRVNRVSEPNRRAFLRLINGPAWQSQGDLDRDIRSTLAGLRHCKRAVTAHDFESLAMAVNDQSESRERVARAHCLPRRNLEVAGALVDAPGHVTVLILPTTESRPSEELLRRVLSILEPARLITTRVHVAAPRFAAVRIRFTLVIQKHAVPATVRENAIAALEKFFDPLEGGPDGFGWPFGRDIYVSEVYRILALQPWVLSVTRTVDRSTQESLDELVVDSADNWRLVRNRLGELEAIDLQPDELVSVRPDAADIEVKHQNL
jgi:hypothetical protein